LLCGCVAGAATVNQIEAWLGEAGFEDVRITVKPESRELIESWTSGRGVENYVIATAITARKPPNRQ
jgi:hypothetical protein